MKTLQNHVLVRLTKKTDEINFGGISMSIETVFDEERHQRLVGIVEQVPEELIFELGNHSLMPWECDMEVQIGDQVIIGRSDVSLARGQKRSFEKDGHLFVFVPYKSLILAKRLFSVGYNLVVPKEGQVEIIEEGCQFIYDVIMLNGYMLVEQDDEDIGANLILPQVAKERKAQTGTIRFIGKPNLAYQKTYDTMGNETGCLLPDNMFDLKIGDKVLFLKYSSIDLEFDIHRTFNGLGKYYVRMQRNKILCKL